MFWYSWRTVCIYSWLLLRIPFWLLTLHPWDSKWLPLFRRCWSRPWPIGRCSSRTLSTHWTPWSAASRNTRNTSFLWCSWPLCPLRRRCTSSEVPKWRFWLFPLCCVLLPCMPWWSLSGPEGRMGSRWPSFRRPETQRMIYKLLWISTNNMIFQFLFIFWVMKIHYI